MAGHHVRSYRSVSITFRLSALSAHDLAEERWLREVELSQLPFGSVPFRHANAVKFYDGKDHLVSITFRLSALSALATDSSSRRKRRITSQLPFGSVPFRHSVRGAQDGKVQRRVSQLPFGSVPFRHQWSRLPGCQDTLCLNYLSAQCPFGTRLSSRSRTSSPSTSQLPFGSVPFRHV